MKRRIITHTVTELETDDDFEAYLGNVAMAYGRTGQALRLVHNLRTIGSNELVTKHEGCSVTTKHTVEVIDG